MNEKQARDPFLALLDKHHELDDLTANEPWKQEVAPRNTPSGISLLFSWVRYPLLAMSGSMFAWWAFINNPPSNPR